MPVMDLSSPSPEARPVRPYHRPRLSLRGCVSGLALLLLAIFLLVIFSDGSSRQFKWLSASQSARMMKQGALTRLKFKLQAALVTILQHFQTKRTDISINLRAATFSTTASMQAELGPPAYTNSAGARCWILSPEQRAAFRGRLDSDFDDSNMAVAPEITTEEGRLGSTWTVPVSYIMSLVKGTGTSINTNIGATFDTLAKSSSGSVNLLFSAASAEVVWYSNKNPVVIKSNFITACRVLVPDGGAVVIDCGRVLNPDQTNQWLMVSPVLVDPAGMPIKR